MTDSITASAAPRGYVSAEARRTFTITAGLVGAGFFFGQFLLPMVIWLLYAPTMLLGGMQQLRVPLLQSAAFWDGRLWYVEQTMSTARGMKAETFLNTLVPGSEQQPETVGSLEGETFTLLTGDDRLWLISADRVGFYRNGEIEMLPRRPLGNISRAFTFGGEPAVMAEGPDSLTLEMLVDGEWETRLAFAVAPDRTAPAVEDLQVVSLGGALHFFRPFGKSIYHWRYAPGDEAAFGDWEPVTTFEQGWQARELRGRPAIVCIAGKEFGIKLLGQLWSKDGWEPFLDQDIGFAFDLGACGTRDGEVLYVLIGGFPGSLQILKVENGEAVRVGTSGGGWPFGPQLFSAMMFIWMVPGLLLPFALALILSTLMARHRITSYQTESGSALQASLWRRALAQAIDAAILAGPLVLGYFLAMRALFDRLNLFDAPSGLAALTGVGLILVGFLWALLCFLLFTFTEGRWGRTPGKWLLGIRVTGLDLEPCGFVRALVRNLLKFVDGFFNFLVGILVVTLSENWQRLGDMAARTVVIRSRPGEAFPAR